MRVPVDYFGVAGNALVQDLLNMSSNKRKRRVAFNNLVRMAKAVRVLAGNSTVQDVGIFVDAGGSQWLVFREGTPEGLGGAAS